jgi:hypothetical protein
MSIRIQCPGCEKTLKAREELAGRKLKCPGCGVAVTVPFPEEPAAELPPVVKTEPAALAAPPRLPVPPPMPPASTVHRRKLGLEGLSPDYRIKLMEWYNVSGPHIGKILAPSIGYFLLFALIYTIVVLLHFIIIGFLLDFTVIPALAVGLHIVSQKQLRGVPWTFGTFFSGFKYIWPLTASALLMFLVPVVFFIPFFAFSAICAAVFGGGDPPPVVSALLTCLTLGCSCGMIYFMVRLGFFSHYLIIDRQCGPVESLKGSWILTRGHFWGLLGSMLLLMVGVYFIGFITLGIGFLFAVPRLVLMLNAGYLLVGGSEPPVGVGDIEPVRRRPAALAWIPAVSVAAVIALVGILAGVGSYMQQEDQKRMLVREKEYRLASMERAKQDAVRAEERHKQDEQRWEAQAKEIVAAFRDGGYWAITVSEAGREFEAAAAAPAPGGELRPGLGGPMGAAGGIEPPKEKVLILGPRGLMKDAPVMKLGRFVRLPAGHDSEAQNLREFHTDWAGGWEAFRKAFEAAMSGGEVEAALAEVKTPAGGPGAAGGGGGGGVTPPGPGLPGASGAEAAGPWFGGLPEGTPIPVADAKPITAARFMELTRDRGWR